MGIAFRVITFVSMDVYLSVLAIMMVIYALQGLINC